MINFIIYEDNKLERELYVSIILKLIGKMKYAYQITEIDKYDKTTLSRINNSLGKKIFIFDIEVPGKSGLDLAREIRNSGDWTSPMMIVTSHEYLKEDTLTAKMLMLDFISKYNNCENNLKDSLELAINILEHHKSLNFQYNGEIFQIPYDNILYIEKNVDDPYSTIVTKTSKVEIKKTISALEKELDDTNKFLRTHRSCIVNINNITSVELKDCIIKFGPKHFTTLLSRDKKPVLKSLLSKKGTIIKDKELV